MSVLCVPVLFIRLAGDVEPAFIPVWYPGCSKAMTPEMLRETGARAVFSNAFHLYLGLALRWLNKLAA